jgi:hypothetical protein
MKAILIALTLSAANLAAQAGEHYNLVVANPQNQQVDSDSITLNQGDTAELKFAHHPAFRASGNSWLLRMVVNAGGQEHEIPSVNITPIAGGGYSCAVNPVKVAGPAVIKMRIGDTGNTGAASGFATVEVNRAGTAGTPTGIPLEAGTTWQVILESSTDLVNWTPTAPGDYPSGSPTRFFRTRLVKRP